MCPKADIVERMFFGDLSKMGIGEKDTSLKIDCLRNNELPAAVLCAFLY